MVGKMAHLKGCLAVIEFIWIMKKPRANIYADKGIGSESCASVSFVFWIHFEPFYTWHTLSSKVIGDQLDIFVQSGYF